MYHLLQVGYFLMNVSEHVPVIKIAVVFFALHQ